MENNNFKIVEKISKFLTNRLVTRFAAEKKNKVEDVKWANHYHYYDNCILNLNFHSIDPIDRHWLENLTEHRLFDDDN